MTNNQVLLKEIIEQQFNSQSEYTEKDEFFEFFSAAQILKDYNLLESEQQKRIQKIHPFQYIQIEN